MWVDDEEPMPVSTPEELEEELEGTFVALAAEHARAWAEFIAPYGRGVEEVAWSLVCVGFEGSLEQLARVVVGAVAEVVGTV